MWPRFTPVGFTVRQGQLLCGPAAALHARGLYTIPGWGGGRYLRGTDLRWLADNPPSLEDALATDYSGGLSILAGTKHENGGYVLEIDQDRPLETTMPLPAALLYREEGTTAGKLHDFIRSSDRLEGQITLRDSCRDIVAEVKGRGYALRSWPTMPPDKPGGYTPLVMAIDPRVDPPRLTATEVADGLADYLTRALGEPVVVDPGLSCLARTSTRAAPGYLVTGLEALLEARGVQLRPSGRDGWQLGWCPFHNDRHQKSFSVSLTLGAWHCWTGCGSGGLRNLARRLGLRHLNRPRTRDSIRIPDFEVKL